VSYVELTAFIIHTSRSCPKLEKGHEKNFHSTFELSGSGLFG